MKKIYLILLSISWILPQAFSQRVGINTTTPLETLDVRGNGYFSDRLGIGVFNPLARLHVKDSSVLFEGPGPDFYNPGNPPVEGPGVRMMWYAGKAAFRAGWTILSEWDKDNIGFFSVALGDETMASGVSSIALGEKTWATGTRSTALGFKTWASGGFATAMGHGARAIGSYSTAMGDGTTANAVGAVSLGSLNDTADHPDPINIAGSDRIFQVGNGQFIPTTSNYNFSNAMTILRNGNVGIGILSPIATLDVVRGTAGGGTAQFRGTVHVSQFNYGTNEDTYIRGGKNGANVILNDTKGTGNVGIGTPRPSQKLQVIGNICATGTIGACSDMRYKKDIASISNSLSSVLALNGIYYYWKKNEFPDMQFTDNRQIGFSAQQIEKLFPELVMTDANGYKSMDYGRLTPVLAEAIKEQQKQINAQQQQINELKKMIEKILK